MDWTAVGVMEGRELCNIYYKKPGKSGVGQGKVSEKSGNNFVQSLWEPCSKLWAGSGQVVFEAYLYVVIYL